MRNNNETNYNPYGMFGRVLFLGAHADDIELGAGGFAALLCKQKQDVKFTICSTEGYKPGTTLIQRSVAREQEAYNAAAKLGISRENVHFLECHVGSIQFNLETINKIEKIIHSFNPTTIVTHWPHDTHQDHINAAKAAVAAGRHVQNILFWEPLFPSGRSSTQPFIPQLYVDISAVLPQKKLALTCHVSQYKKYQSLGFDWLEAIEIRAKQRGLEVTRKYCETFFIERIQI